MSPTRPRRVAGQSLWVALILAPVLLLGIGCEGGDGSEGGAGGTAGSGQSAPGPPVRIASFDFSESRVLAELYAGALRESGYPVTLTLGLGAREVVEPALEQGAVDFVVEYAGTLLRFLARGAVPDEPAAVQAALRSALSARGLAVLDFAAAQEQNGFAVTAEWARQSGRRKLTELAPISASLVFGGPPECPERPYCLKGLQRTYGLQFRMFRPMSSRAATAEALSSGEIDVGLFETTSARLADGRFVLLADDLGLQPPEHLVPVIRQQVLTAHGDGLARVVNAVTGQLTTAELIRLNRRAEIDGIAPAKVAAEWLAAHPGSWRP